MAYEKINWKNYPDKTTLISAENLNHMDEGIYDLDQNKISNDKITQRENITQEGYVLDGREKNPNEEGTLAKQLVDFKKKAITTDNIGQQSVKYASSAGTAANASKVLWSGVQGKPSTYPPSSHSHNYLPNNPPCIEIMGQGGVPFIDFHYGGSSADYTTRIIDTGSGLSFLNAEGNNFTYGGKSGHSIAISSLGEFVAYNDHVILRADNVQCTSRDGATYIPVYGASFTNPSSKLIKENIESMSDEEAKKVLQLNPVTFDYIEEFGGEHDQRGLIAEETLKIIPSCVSVPENYSEEDFDIEKGIANEVLAIDYSKLVPYLIKMVQIQQKEIEKLKEAMNKEGGKENE